MESQRQKWTGEKKRKCSRARRRREEGRLEKKTRKRSEGEKLKAGRELAGALPCEKPREVKEIQRVTGKRSLKVEQSPDATASKIRRLYGNNR
jgi:hypothetical protein